MVDEFDIKLNLFKMKIKSNHTLFEMILDMYVL